MSNSSHLEEQARSLPEGPVRAYPIFCLRADNRAESLLAVVLDQAAAAALEAEFAYQGNRGWVNWDDLPLQCDDGPCTEVPDIQFVHLVTAGAVRDSDADVFSPGTAIGVFTSLDAALDFATRQGQPDVMVRTVELGVPLELGF